MRKEAMEQKQFMRTGMVASAIMNFSERHPEKHVSAMEFVPGHSEKQTMHLDQMTPEEVASHLISQFGKKEYRQR